jgi:hypothetical protein
MHELSLVDYTFEKERTNQYHLSIQSGLNGFSFCIFDNLQQKHIAFRKYVFETSQLLENYLAQLDEIFKNDDLLKFQFASSAFLYLSQKSTLIPETYFNKNELKSYFEFNHSIDMLDEIHYNYLPSVNAYNVFALHSAITNEVCNQVKGIRFYHQALPFIEKILQLNSGFTKQVITICLNYSFFDLTVTSGNKLFLYNTFQYGSKEDLLYYILFICRKFNLNPGETDLFLSGELSDMMLYYDAIREYFPGTKHITNTGFGLASSLNKIKEYKYINLFNLSFCA